MADIFISYASTDRDFVAVLADVAEKIGFTVWWDRRLLPHERIEETIKAELDAAKAVVVVWSTASIESDWVRSEADRARRQGKLINTIHEDLAATAIPMPFDQVRATSLSDRRSILNSAWALVEPKKVGSMVAVPLVNDAVPHFITDAINDALKQARALSRLLKRKGLGSGTEFAIRLRAAAEQLEKPLRLFRERLPYDELRSYANRQAIDRLDLLTEDAHKECQAEIRWLTRSPDNSAVVDGAREDLSRVADQVLEIGSAPKIVREGHPIEPIRKQS